MSTSAISAFNSITQPLSQISGTSLKARNDQDGDNNGAGRISGRGHRQGGDPFFQDVVQSLQSLGINLSGALANNSSTSTTTDSSSTQAQGTTSASEVRQALHTFLSDLHQALKPGGAQKQAAAGTNNDGANDGSSASSSLQDSYGSFSANLQNLISSLSSTGNTNSPSNGSSNSSASNALQTDFSNLVNALGGSSSSSSPSLQSFLQQLANNIGNNPGPTGSGVIIKTQA
ncbi:MAG: hypothetical protein WC782_07195 [Methylococcaceae bacterium]|jgi:hypothetical protein